MDFEKKLSLLTKIINKPITFYNNLLLLIKINIVKNLVLFLSNLHLLSSS